MRVSRRRSLALAAALSVVLMILIAYVWPVQDPYHPLNEDWDGCSKITGTTKSVTIVVTYDTWSPAEPSLLAIIGPNIVFSKNEGSRIRSFLNLGGTVLLADDFGTGNSLLEELKVAARFSKTPVADLLFYSKQPAFPLIVEFSPSPVTVNVAMILTNHPSYIDIANSRSVVKLASTSSFSFVDWNGDNRPELNETITSYPVMASVQIGDGLLVLVSDASMFMNEMIELYDNMRLFKNILNMGRGSLLLDVAHLARAPLTDERIGFRNTINSIRSYVLSSQTGLYIQFLVVIALIAGFSFAISRRMSRRMPNQTLYSG